MTKWRENCTIHKFASQTILVWSEHLLVVQIVNDNASIRAWHLNEPVLFDILCTDEEIDKRLDDLLAVAKDIRLGHETMIEKLLADAKNLEGEK